MLAILLDAAVKLALVSGVLIAATANDYWPRKVCHGTSLMNPNDHTCTYYIGR